MKTIWFHKPSTIIDAYAGGGDDYPFIAVHLDSRLYWCLGKDDTDTEEVYEATEETLENLLYDLVETVADSICENAGHNGVD